MGKFNRSKAEQIVKDVIANHITQYGNIVYEPTGFLPYVNGKAINGDKDYPTLMSKIRKELRKSFVPTKTYMDFINGYMYCIIRNSGLVVGICKFDINNTPTYSTAKSSSITIEVIKDEDHMSADEISKFNTFINSI